ncbi:MAG: ATP-dependent Clp protease ATP-binding subunit ClpX, partial [Verrucomicrobiales bacterium]|nr:ATP-dependent Clp protease ATP-binding subunit ClpX [Verrucomicrobiales bacterium]
NILFICGGAFVGLDKVVQRRLGNRVMGFRANDSRLDFVTIEPRSVVQYVEPEDLLGYGFIPEFIGRLPMITVLEELTEEQLAIILTDPKNALTKQFAKLMAMEGVDLHFSADALAELASLAKKKGTGARALRGILERIMLDVMYEVPGNDDIVGITITSAVVRDEVKPLMRRKQDKAAA